MPAPAFTDLAADLDRLAEERDLSGSFLLTAAGETVFEHCCGYADRASRTPVTPATRFALASLTKMFTAVAVTRLVAEGRLGFETRVVDVLPPERRPATLHPAVTVHHLLCHTSGIADYCEEDEDSPAYVEDYDSLWDDLPVSRMEHPVDFLPLFGDRPAYRPPGEAYQYSNAGYVVLGLVVEEVTGEEYVDAVQTRVLDPAGMGASGFFRSDEPVPEVAVGYLPRPTPGSPWRSNVFRVPVVGGADGGAHATAGDVDRFLHAYADGTLLGDLGPTVVSRHADAGDGFAYGYGVLLYPDGRLGHGGGDPGVEVMAHRWPEEQVDLVVLCNVEDQSADVRDRMVDAARTVGVLGPA
ncbi:serine hydrolase domain-containing protein [Nocardioides aurantiacus]|uniref:serine hydrolase domain-containing protein n=1 Tax=Nocardioides aurantiacus TaxID=86796 RepID=UPI00403F7E47